MGRKIVREVLTNAKTKTANLRFSAGLDGQRKKQGKNLPRKYRSKGDCAVFLGLKSKKPFMYTTLATINLLGLLIDEMGMTWQQIHDFIRYDPDAKTIAKAYCDAGYGNECPVNQIVWDWWKGIKKRR